eukprot:16281_1
MDFSEYLWDDFPKIEFPINNNNNRPKQLNPSKNTHAQIKHHFKYLESIDDLFNININNNDKCINKYRSNGVKKSKPLVKVKSSRKRKRKRKRVDANLMRIDDIVNAPKKT